MSFGIIKSGRRQKEKRIGRYMREVREIGKARLSRRELFRTGALAGLAGLAGAAGCGGGGSGGAASIAGVPGSGGSGGSDDPVISPPATPFVEPLPIPAVTQPVSVDPAPTKGPNPLPSAVTGFTEAQRPDHQRWEEFLPTEAYECIQQEVAHSFSPDLPPSRIWTYVEASTGRAGPLWVQARYGDPVLFRIHNALPVDNRGFGINQTTIHNHGGHQASESDGGPTKFFDAGVFYDYHYPNVRAGFARTHPETTLNGRTVPGDVRETQSFLWFHDHRFDFTSQNVYKGLFGIYTLFSDDILLDTGDETTGLRLPSGEFDIPLVFTDKLFDPVTGELFFDLFNIDGQLGDTFCVNFKVRPFLEVKRRKYRFRLLDGGPARVYEFFLSSGQPFIQISNDGNLLPRPLFRRSIRLGVAERADVIVDFSNARIGDRIYLQNRLEQRDGRGPTGEIAAPTDLVEFRVVGDARDDSLVPDVLLDIPDRNIPIAATREWKFDRRQGAWTVNNEFFDPQVISAFPKLDTAEIWTFESGGGWYHPIHNHLEEFIILDRDGDPPPIEEVARKDVVAIGDSAIGDDNTGRVRILVQFRDYLGDFPLHCHNTLHEDHAMMIRWEVVP